MTGRRPIGLGTYGGGRGWRRMIDACACQARFVWVDAENAPFLTDRLNIWMLPTIVCIKMNKVEIMPRSRRDLAEISVADDRMHSRR